VDLDKSNSLEKGEIEAVFGVQADTLLAKLSVNEEGSVSMKDWVAHVAKIEESAGVSDVDNFLSFCEGKVRDFKAEKEAKKEQRKRDMAKAKASQSEETKAAKEALEKKLAMQPEKKRLEDRGIVIDKDEAEVKKMNKAAAASALETKLNLRPDRESLEAKGKIKDKETVEAQKAQKANTQALLSSALNAQPQTDHASIAQLRAKFVPRAKESVCKEVFDKFAPSSGVMDLAGEEFRAALSEVSQAFGVSLNLDAIISDAQAELEVQPDFEGFMDVLDVVENLIDVYMQ